MDEVTINLGQTEDVLVKDTSAEVVPTDIEDSIQTPEFLDKYLVNVDDLKVLITMARKIANYNPNDTLSQVLNLRFDNTGIKANASNARYSFQSGISNRYKYIKPLDIYVDIKAFGDFINNIDVPEIELTYNEVNNVTTINLTTGGQFKFPQRVESSTNAPIVSVLKYDIAYEDMIAFDFEKFINVIKQAKPVREFATNPTNEINPLRSTYFGNIVISSVESFMFMQENQDALNKGVSISDELCNILSVLKFDVNNCRVGYVDITPNIIGMSISDGKTVICGPVEKTTILPLDTCNQFWDMDFNTKIEINTRAFVKALKQISPFLNWAEKDGDVAIFTINNDTILVETDNGIAKDYVDIINKSGYTHKLYLNVGKLYKFLQTIKSETFEIAINQKMENHCICLNYEAYKCIIAQTHKKTI